MSPPRLYLDDLGSAPLLHAARAARLEAPAGNPQSVHREGRTARAALDRARDRAAAALGRPALDLVFCGSGTEAVNLALLGTGRRLPRDRSVVTWEAEHPSVLAAVRRLSLEGVRVHVLPVDAGCLPDAAAIPAGAGLISTSMANSEVGTLQPVPAIAARAREIGALLHVDCCQGARWLPPPVEEADLASFSGHKLGAGGGGLLYADRELLLEPLQVGGPQEFGRRAGHLDAGLAAAVAAALDETARRRTAEAERVAPLADRLRVALAELGGTLVGAAPRLPNVAAAAFADRRGEDLLLALDLAGIAASSGAACAAGALDPSVVLLAMGRSLAEAEGSLRLSAGYETTAADVEGAVAILGETLRSRAASGGSGGAAAPSRP